MTKTEASEVMSESEALSLIKDAINFWYNSSFSGELFFKDKKGNFYPDEIIDTRGEAFAFWVRNLTFRTR